MKDVIFTAITEALTELLIHDADFVIEHPVDLNHGDYTCNVALAVAKGIGKSPRDVAEQLLKALNGQIEYVERIEIAGPGFLNFYLHRDWFTKEVARALEQGEAWGRNDNWTGKKVVVEYTDPNPFKEFHIGHVFTNSVGESVARLFMMAGADTKRVNYQGDVGLHVANAIYGIKELGLTVETGLTAKDLGRAYSLGSKAYKEDDVAKETIRDINKKVYSREDGNINSLYDAGRQASLNYFESIYQILDTKFDEYFFESQAANPGKDLVVSHPEVFTDSEGAKVFVGEPYGLHTRVFLNSEGLPTYEAKELALAKLKEERLGVYDHSVISTANEISEYFKVLKQAMSMVYPDLAEKTEHIGHGTVRLSTGKMSSRTGDVISAIDFIEEVKQAAINKVNDAGVVKEVSDELATDIAVGAIKYATLKSNILQDSVFDKDQALSFEGNSGPYLQYTHARIGSALEKAKGLGILPSYQATPELPYIVERWLYRFPEVVESALEDREPHQVATFLIELAAAFNSFYATEKIADVADNFAPYKMALAQAVALTLKKGLWVLGIKAPGKM